MPVLGLIGAFGVTSARADTGFTPDQRREIVEIMRNALKTDPTILSDAITALRAQGEADTRAKTLAAVRANADKLGASTSDIVLGNPHGRYAIVEFYDPRCPYCRKVLPDLDRLVQDEPDLRLVEKVIPVLGAGSQLDAQAIIAAGLQGGYLKLQHALMTDAETPSIARIRKLAGDSGLDVERLVKDMSGPAVMQALKDNLELARTVNVEGTPTFLIGDQDVIPGAVTVDDLKAALGRLRNRT